jgi:hypothetical protein
VGEILAQLEKKSSRRIRDEMLTRYGITASKAFGVKMSEMQKIARRFGRDHGESLHRCHRPDSQRCPPAGTGRIRRAADGTAGLALPASGELQRRYAGNYRLDRRPR